MAEDLTNTPQVTSFLHGYSEQLIRLAGTMTGMLSQCQALGTRLGEDRAAIERLAPAVTELSDAIQSTLTYDATQQDGMPSATRTSGARVIEWSPPQPKATTESVESARHVVEPPTPHREVEVEPGVETDFQELDDRPELPAVDRCADLLMADLHELRTADESPAAEPQGEITLQGTNESLPLATVFQFLGQTKKSGTLRLRTNTELMTFEIADGDLVFSSTDAPPEGQLLGQILVAMKLVSEHDLKTFLARHDDKIRLGSALENGELLAVADLRRALEVQIRHRLDRAFSARESAFTFTEGSSARPHHRIRMNVTELLLESL
jgi:hypothetical protein